MDAPHADWLWDDIRFFLAICREGSLSAAARNLGVNHSTVGRRLTASERQLGARLINRTRNGLMLTPTGRQILSDCENMEAAAQAVQRRAAGQDTLSAGLVSIATTDTLAFQLIAPALAELRPCQLFRGTIRFRGRNCELSRKNMMEFVADCRGGCP